VLAAKDGGECIELVLRERPNVAVVDIALPHIDGCGVAQRVRASLGDERPRLVALTGLAWDNQQAMQAGFDAYLRKPASAPELRRVLMTQAVPRRVEAMAISGQAG
jgi:CheY-like chemotaxis protein